MKTCVDCATRITSSSPRCPACRRAYRLAYHHAYDARVGPERRKHRTAGGEKRCAVDAALESALRRVRASGRYTLTPETIYAQSAVWRQQWADLADLPRGGSLERAESERRRKA